jgi:hypothetical protein
MQNEEYQRLIEVHPVYGGLENRKVAVVVDVDYAVLYEHGQVPLTVADFVSRRIQSKVPGALVVSPVEVSNWQFRTYSWQGMPYGEMARQLGADRLVLVDIFEYRLNPPGNRWLWEGLCAANVQVIEGDSLDPDTPVESFVVEASFPRLKGVARDSASATAVETGLLREFCTKAAWLFYRHLEPKHPDHYRGPPPETREHELYEKG